MSTFNEKNLKLFSDTYRTELKAAVAAYPSEYGFPVERADAVADRMLLALTRKSYNKDGIAFKNTCKILGIRHTYKAIDAYLREGNKT